jgi:PKD repeat protein
MVRAFRTLTFVLLTVALVAGCTVKDTPAPPLTGPSTLSASIVAAFTFSPSSPAEGVTVSFDAALSSGTGSIAFYNWNFDDGGSGSGRTVSHRFLGAGTYRVSLTVGDTAGHVGTTTGQVKVVAGSVPTAAFEFSPGSPNTNDTIYFNALASAAGAGRTITQYLWTFGDGFEANGVSTSHAYAAKNSYSVTLQVTNDAGMTATTTKQITVGAPTAPAVPVASFVVTPVQPIPNGTPVGFDGSGSTATSPAIIVSYSWDFGDGTSATGPVVTHTFTNTSPAGFIVILTVTDSNGQVGRKSQVVSVQ